MTTRELARRAAVCLWLGVAAAVGGCGGGGSDGGPAAGAAATGAAATDATSGDASSAGASSAGASSAGASSAGAPSAGAPSTGVTPTGAPSTGAPSTGAPSTGAPASGAAAPGTGATDAAAKVVTVSNPTVIGPVPAAAPPGDPSRDYPQLATQADLARYGYVEQEFFFQGTASRYDTSRALQTGTVVSSGHPYKSRMLVRRPTDPARFNGVVVVEWLNVTSGYNYDLLWQASSDFFMREGYAYVGVSAQRVGVQQAPSGLTVWSPTRYGTLDVTAGGTVTDDSLSYDVFAQGARAVQNPQGIDPLGNLPAPRLVLASGVSQSQGRLVTYHNAVHPLHQLFDGFYLYLGTGGRLRADLDVKVFKINTENDVALLGEGRARQPDSDVLRTWEIAGASHVNEWDMQVRMPLVVRDALPIPNTNCTLPALSRVPAYHVLNAAYGHLVRWIDDDTPPPVAEPIRLASLGSPAVPATPTTPAVPATPSVPERDDRGNALGGIRLAEHAVPTATNTGVNSGSAFCTLYGVHQPFDAATLAALYPARDRYLSAVGRFTDFNLRAGYILAPEAEWTRQRAAASGIGR